MRVRVRDRRAVCRRDAWGWWCLCVVLQLRYAVHPAWGDGMDGRWARSRPGRVAPGWSDMPGSLPRRPGTVWNVFSFFSFLSLRIISSAPVPPSTRYRRV